MTLPHNYLNHVETIKQLEKRVTILEEKFATMKSDHKFWFMADLIDTNVVVDTPREEGYWTEFVISSEYKVEAKYKSENACWFSILFFHQDISGDCYGHTVGDTKLNILDIDFRVISRETGDEIPKGTI